MGNSGEFEDIRPYHDDELPEVLEELVTDAGFLKALAYAIPELSQERLIELIRQSKTKKEFQRNLSYVFLWNVANKTGDSLQMDLSSAKDRTQPYTFISNHRDIVLDSGFLSILLMSEGLNTVEIAIGDNLLFLPWIKKLVRVNKSFIVQRGLSMRQVLESSARLSRYMHYAIDQKRESIWIAQREGRAKDANDRTQESLLKMLSMGGEGDIIDRLISLHILPLSLSYEYDPCDFLKAEEFQLKRDNPDYKKSFEDDLRNMQTGILGYKGHIMFRTGNPINPQLEQLDRRLPKQDIYAAVAALIDKEIHRNYTIYPGNYVAHDLLNGQAQFAEQYSPEDKSRFEKYIEGQIAKISLADKDEDFLRKKLLAMYANPLINHLKAVE